jgi:hypothetical protein
MLSCFRPNCFRTGMSLEFPSRCGNLANKLVPQNSGLPLNKLSVLRVCVISESKQATAGFDSGTAAGSQSRRSPTAVLLF